MRLEKLEIQGFKSFAKRVEIRFDEGITAIVGPNGSGKSNIGDAIRWVLGEQSAKALRGGKMEDVIFSGSETAKAKAYCEVILTFDNSDGALPVEYKELAVARRAYRSGESEYSINRQPCRLRDVVDLFRDTGIGKAGYSIIGQGRVDEILSGKSEDRRMVFEEAAGISKYKARKQEAERKLNHTRENLCRVEDILAELGSRLEPLREQSERAKEYLRLREELRDIELNAFLQQYEKAMADMDAQRALEGELTQEYAQASEALEAQKQARAATEARLAELEQQVERENVALLAASTALERAEGDLRLGEEKQRSAEEERQRLGQEQGSLEEEIREKQGVLQSAGGLVEERARRIAALETELMAQEEALTLLSEDCDAREKALDELKNTMLEEANRRANIEVQRTRLESMQSSLQERLDALLEAAEKARTEGAALEEEREQEQRKLEELMNAAQRWRDEDAAHREALQRSKDALQGWLEEGRALEKRRDEGRSRLKVLGEMTRDYEGFYNSVRRLLQDCQKDPDLGRGIVGVVAELINVPQNLETAIEMTLGSALQQVVCESEQDARRAIEYLRKMRYGRVTFLPISSVRGCTLNDGERRSLGRAGCLGVASELVEYDPKYRGIVEQLLGRTAIVEDLESGIALARENRQSFRISSLAGDIINPGGSMTGGSRGKSEYSLLGRRREMEDLEKRIADYESNMRVLSEKIAGEQAALSDQKEGRASRAGQLQILEVDIARQREKVEMLDKLCRSHGEETAEGAEQRSQLEDTLQDIREQLSGLEQAAEQTGDAEDAQRDVSEQQRTLYELRQRRDQGTETLHEQQMALQRAQNEESNETKERQRMEEAILAAQKRLEKLARERERLEGGGLDWQEDVKRAASALESARGELSAAQEKKERVQSERQQVQAERTRQEEELERSRQRVQELEERRQKCDLRIHKLELDNETLQERIWNDYELTYETAAPYRREVNLAAEQKRLQPIRGEIRALGEVNVNAIEDYQDVKARHEEITGQVEDLRKAEQDLNTLIADLLGEMSKRFKEQFALINRNFGETFKKLFGGGRAELRLGEGEDVLQSDIEIIAQPPGKNLQLLSLLSGGERALTAIALLFAILQLKPTPFCILDEIEASLDEANVDNFASYVKDYSQNTQFIMITHRKGSMMVGDTLYGVAMEGSGVSRLVSVRVSEAEKILAEAVG